MEKLTNLRSLDLSFNLIEKIENLNNLTFLEDLSVFHNKISLIEKEDLESLKNLNSLSIGYNKLSDVHRLGTALKSLNKLQILNVKNNPLENDIDYKSHLIKSVPQIKYLDY